jgi:hypothetical protein
MKNNKYLIFLLLFSGCISPNAIQSKIATFENRMDKLEKIIDNKIDSSVVAENIDTLKQEFHQELISIKETTTNFGTIKYGGSWAVIIGMSVVIIIFLSVIGLTIKYYLKANKTTNMLGLVTTAVKNSSPEISDGIKAQIKKETSNGGPYNEKHQQQLSEFVKNN